MRYIELTLTTNKPVYINVESIKYFQEVYGAEGDVVGAIICVGDNNKLFVKEIHTKIVSGSPLVIK